MQIFEKKINFFCTTALGAIGGQLWDLAVFRLGDPKNDEKCKKKMKKFLKKKSKKIAPNWPELVGTGQICEEKCVLTAIFFLPNWVHRANRGQLWDLAVFRLWGRSKNEKNDEKLKKN